MTYDPKQNWRFQVEVPRSLEKKLKRHAKRLGHSTFMGWARKVLMANYGRGKPKKAKR